jgi:protein-S-isoprenylcysteine O-methyltransferase Ste14
MRIPAVALFLPEWAFTLPSGLLVAAGVWLFGRRRSPFLRHHAREGFKLALQANLLLAALSLLAKGFYYAWFFSGLAPINALWHLGATIFRWAGVLVTVLTLAVMLKAARGETSDALTLSTR